MTDGNTLIFATPGNPVAQVRLPQVMEVVFARLGINAVWVPMHVDQEGLRTVVEALRTLRNFRGITVAIPHKPAIGAMLDRRFTWTSTEGLTRSRREALNDFTALAAQFSAYKNKSDALAYGCRAPNPPPDKRVPTTAELQAAQSKMNKFYCGLRSNTPKTTADSLMGFWTNILGLNIPDPSVCSLQ